MFPLYIHIACNCCIHSKRTDINRIPLSIDSILYIAGNFRLIYALERCFFAGKSSISITSNSGNNIFHRSFICDCHTIIVTTICIIKPCLISKTETYLIHILWLICCIDSSVQISTLYIQCNILCISILCGSHITLNAPTLYIYRNVTI